MKLFKSSHFLLGLGLLSGTLTCAIQPSEARPQRDRVDNRRGDWRNDRNKDRDNDRYEQRDRRRNRQGQRPGGNYGYGNGGGYGRYGGAYGRGGNYGYGNGGGYGYGNGGYGYGGNYGYGNPDVGNRNQSFTGRVTNVKSADEFDIRIGNTVYNVYTNSRAPRRLSVGDTVRVYGQRVGKNDIRNANVSLLSNNNRW